MAGETEPGDFLGVARDLLLAVSAPLFAWMAWVYTKFRRDSKMLNQMRSERLEYRKRFKLGLVEHTQDLSDGLIELATSQMRCDEIHRGMPEGQNSGNVITMIRGEIRASEERMNAKIDSFKKEDLEYKRQLSEDVSWIRESLSS